MIKKIVFFLITAVMMVFLAATQEGVYGQKVTAVSSQEFFENYLHLLEDGKTVVIDGRTQRMFSEGHLKNAINIDADDTSLVPLLEQHLDEPLIVVYCTTVRRTTDIVNALRDMYEGEIMYINDGLRGWKSNGYPVCGISPLSPKEDIEEVLQNNGQ